MNWQELFNWSMKHTDSTGPSEFKPMDEESKASLKKTLDSMIVNEVDPLRKGSLILSDLEIGSEEECIRKEHAANQMLSTLENLDTALNLVKLGGLKHVIRCMIGSQYLSVRKLCASIFTTSVQNSPPVQKNAVEEHALEGLIAVIPSESDLGLKEQYISCLSGLIRGEFRQAREAFVKMEGLNLIHHLLLEFQSVRIVKKVLLLLSDILFNSRNCGMEDVTISCAEEGILDTVASYTASDDAEIVDMANWVIHNSMV